jgi:hypothetical protein
MSENIGFPEKVQEIENQRGVPAETLRLWLDVAPAAYADMLGGGGDVVAMDPEVRERQRALMADEVETAALTGEADARLLVREMLTIYDRVHVACRPLHGAPRDAVVVETEDQLAEWFRKHRDGGQALQYTVGEPREGWSGNKAKRGDIGRCGIIPVDLDPAAGADPAEQSRQLIQKAEMLRALPIPPTICVFSGNGVQPLWFTETPIENAAAGMAIGSREDLPKEIRDLERAAVILGEALGGKDAKEGGNKDVSVANIAGFMRLPGSDNHPTEKKATEGRRVRRARVLYYTGRRVPNDQILSFARTVAELVKDDLVGPDVPIEALSSDIWHHLGGDLREKIERHLESRAGGGLRRRLAELPADGLRGGPLPYPLYIGLIGHLVHYRFSEEETCEILRPLGDVDQTAKRYREFKAKDEDRAAAEEKLFDQMDETYAIIKEGASTVVYERATMAYPMSLKQITERTARMPRIMPPPGSKRAPRILGDAWFNAERTKKQEYVPVWQPNPRVVVGDGEINMWQGLASPVLPFDQATERQQALFGKIRHHLLHSWCDGNPEYLAYVDGYFADMVQNPDQVPGVALVLISEDEGAGKGIIAEQLMRTSIGDAHFHKAIDSSQLTNKFNSSMAYKVLIYADEADLGNSRSAKKLKGMIDTGWLTIEHKGVDSYDVRNYARWIIASNELDAVRIEPKDRRFFSLRVVPPFDRFGGSEAEKAEYFAYMTELGEAVNDVNVAGICLWYWLEYDLSGFDIRQRPLTELWREQRELGRHPYERWIIDVMMRCELRFKDQGAVGRETMMAIPFDSSWAATTHTMTEDYALWCSRERVTTGVMDSPNITRIGKFLRRVFPSAVRERKISTEQIGSGPRYRSGFVHRGGLRAMRADVCAVLDVNLGGLDDDAYRSVPSVFKRLYTNDDVLEMLE